METLRLKVDTANLASEASQSAIARAAEILRGGGTVAFPTETVYGLGANALDVEAVKKIFVAKDRPSWDPLIVHIGEGGMLKHVAAQVTGEAARLVERLTAAFWPGPLTMLLPRSAEIPELVTAGLERVGVRMPAHPVTRALLAAAGVPVAAPSANRFGRTSPTTAEHVAEDLDGRIDAILDAGETTHGVESTVVDVRAEGCVIYRPGVITQEQLAAACGARVWALEGKEEPESAKAAPAPGMGIRHYAPRAKLVLVEGEGRAQMESLAQALRACEAAGDAVGVMLPDEFRSAVAGGQVQVYRWGRLQDAEELAQRLYAGLRELDAAGVTAIVCPMPRAEGIGVAVRDRLLRAANRG
ncbi:MAG TPA: L-threonylcarbamoyladenylate synthase [Acidobacteriaceae bacterium]|nr:L-threonylcarbamoyladenylate synthase [Acidobacteriaceae bacterium]